jgi:hypothetical protein
MDEIDGIPSFDTLAVDAGAEPRFSSSRPGR